MFSLANTFLAGSVLSAGANLFSAYEQRQAAKSEIKQYQQQQMNLQMERANIKSQYAQNRVKMMGEYEATAGHGGVKVSGSIANALNNSLTEMNIEEAQRDYNLKSNIQTAKLNESNAQRTKKYAYLNGALRAGSSVLDSYGTYNKYWGTNADTNLKGKDDA